MMEFTEFQQKCATLLTEIKLHFEEPMSKHTSFRIGGTAEVMAFPRNTDELAKILKQSAFLDVKPAILGAGTNILAPDKGIRGLVICLKDALVGMERIDETHICVAAGVSMAKAAVFAAGLGLSGLEFAHGIPGTVGGGVYMNAGAYGGEISGVCKSVQIMSMDGSILTIDAEDMDFSYRHSRLEKEPGIVVSTVFSLVKKPEAEIRARMQELVQRRKASQPLEYPSAGSAFKRPANGYAAALIDQAGLKGFQIGEAAVSAKHAGFIVNLGHASAEDVKSVLSEVSRKVFDQFGVRLEPEIRIW